MWDKIASDEYICALGRVVYEANRLETVAASLLLDYEHMAGKHLKYRSTPHSLTRRTPVGDLIKILSKKEPETDYFGDRVAKDLDWAQKADRLLKRRHGYTHVVYVQFVEDPDLQVIATHVNSDGNSGSYSTLDSPDELFALAAEMLEHRHAGERPKFADAEEGVGEMPPPRPGTSWTLLMPGPNPFAQNLPGRPEPDYPA